MKRVERSNVLIPRSQRITRSFPSFATYSAAMSSSSTVADGAALEQHRLRHAADLGEEVEVLHVARADLDHVGDLEPPPRRRAGSISSVTIGSPVSSRASARISRPFEPEALERVRRRARLERAAAQHRRAGRGDGAGRLERLLARLDGARPGDQPEEAVADPAPANLDHRRVGREPARDERVREELLRPGCVHRRECSAEDDAGRQVQGQSRDAHLLRHPADGRQAPRQLRGRLPPVRRRRRSRARRSSASSTCTRSPSSYDPRGPARARRSTSPRCSSRPGSTPSARPSSRRATCTAHAEAAWLLSSVDELRRAPPDDAVQGEVRRRRSSSRPGSSPTRC